jgi:hypothetical protein
MADLKTDLKGRSPEQQKVIKYFRAPEGCFSKNISDDEYDKLVESKYASLNLKQRALDKTGLDESQVNEIPPCEFRNWYFGTSDDKTKNYAKSGKDGRFRSSAYQVTWLFFSDKQVYVYQYTFNMDEDGKKERTEEYFYKDITNFSTSSESVQKRTFVLKGCLVNKHLEPVDSIVNHDVFQLGVPGDRFFCEMVNTPDAEDKIKAMKNKLREKKG